jgi:hypothetical protein
MANSRLGRGSAWRRSFVHVSWCLRFWCRGICYAAAGSYPQPGQLVLRPNSSPTIPKASIALADVSAYAPAVPAGSLRPGAGPTERCRGRRSRSCRPGRPGTPSVHSTASATGPRTERPGDDVDAQRQHEIPRPAIADRPVPPGPSALPGSLSARSAGRVTRRRDHEAQHGCQGRHRRGPVRRGLGGHVPGSLSAPVPELGGHG